MALVLILSIHQIMAARINDMIVLSINLIIFQIFFFNFISCLSVISACNSLYKKIPPKR